MRISSPLLATSKTVDPYDEKQMKIVRGHLPLFASFKLDGIRAKMQDGKLLSRTMKLIPNLYTQVHFGLMRVTENLDGELIVGDPTDPLCYNKTTSAMMRRDGEPDVKWYVFDRPSHLDFDSRLDSIVALGKLPRTIIMIEQKLCKTWDDVLAYEKKAVDLGYEGLILRRPDGFYKQGRATLKEGIALKFKRMEDSEAVILGMVELQHNLNEQTLREDGSLKRSSHKAGKVGGGTLGALEVRDIHTGVEFEIGTFKGFDADWKQAMWNNRKAIIKDRTLVKYRFFPVGVKDKPRHPVLKGIRWKGDL